MPTITTIKIDALGVVRAFGGPTELRYRLERHGLGELSEYAVAKWIHRQRIPGEWLIAIMLLAKIDRAKFNPLEYVHQNSLTAAARRKITREHGVSARPAI